MDRQVNVSITVGTIAKAIIIGAVAYLVWKLRGLILLILTAIVIASAIEPGVLFFIRHRIPRFVSVLIMYVGVFGGLFAVLYFFLPPIIADASQFLASIPEYLGTLNLPGSLSGIADSAANASQSESILNTLAVFQDAFSSGSGGIVRLLATFFGGIFSLLLVIVLSFYLALQETGVDDFLRLVTPAKHEEYVIDLWQRAKVKIGLWMQGQILLSVIVGVLVSLGLFIMGVQYALFLGIFTALAELVPIFGSLVAGACAAAVGFTQGGFALAFIVAGLYVIVNQFETNLIYPLVVKKVVGIPPLLVIIALIAGGEVAGFLGVLLSVPLAAAAQEFFDDFYQSKRKAG
jgi:predicted PurR-regulated permease PerM